MTLPIKKYNFFEVTSSMSGEVVRVNIDKVRMVAPIDKGQRSSITFENGDTIKVEETFESLTKRISSVVEG